ALDVMVTESGAVDKEIVKSQLDRNIIKRDGDNLIGVTEQLEKLKADKAFLFGAALEKSDTGMSAQLGTQHNDPSGTGDTFGFKFTGVRPAPKAEN
ncbi:MAG: phage scaffolding protein, partial [Oscillospiraceae bacterium]|nr:phage scaffolding protein [Oscillospiraceae bacterium]